MEKALIRYHVIIGGKVQGVSFRYYTKLKADELGVMGWVKNRPDGTVEVLAEAGEQQLRHLKSFLEEGPPAANVESVKTISTVTATGEYSDFQIRY